MKAPPCWLTAILLTIALPITVSDYDFIAGLLNVAAILGWLLAEIYEREIKRLKHLLGKRV